ncbi:MAG TPA: hypothetical protein VFZ31_02160 [Vicinamibacterales bacterium]
MRLLLVTLLLASQGAGPIFRFEPDGFWLNLHHFLYVLGRAHNQAPDAKRAAVVNAPVDQENGLEGLSQRARQDWESAVRYYADGPSKKDAVFDRELIAITNAMRVPPNATAEALKIDPELRATLIRASPIYRSAWWPKHQQENHERARDFARQLEQHGARVRDYITRAYQLDWPREGFLVNISGYTNWAGAYSTDDDLIVIASLDQGGAGSFGLESMFHEAMHQWDQPVLARLSRLAKAHNTPQPREGITHALIWYTAAEAVKSVVPSHTGLAERGGMWRQKGLGSFKAALDAHWQPYLDGTGTLDEALVGLLKS